jgi:hypothetical protein
LDANSSSAEDANQRVNAHKLLMYMYSTSLYKDGVIVYFGITPIFLGAAAGAA